MGNAENDQIGRFIEECCVEMSEVTTSLSSAYVNGFCKKAHVLP
jgi:hypothetical protein